MSTLQILKDAIAQKKSISFEYNKEGKVRGERFGDTYAIYIFTAKSGEQSTKVHVVQYDGVSDTNPPLFPDFRTFNIEELINIKILEKNITYPLHEKYNPESSFYDNVIAKI